MKATFTILLGFCLTFPIFGQLKLGANYQNAASYPSNHTNAHSTDRNINVVAKGLANVKADAYVAIFHVTQIGKTVEEVNKLIDGRIKKALNQIQTLSNVEIYVEMVSFVPIYEYELDKKVFSRNSYKEIPAGFELKKNIHLKFSESSLLNQMVTILSAEDVYDLVKVDYYSTKLETIKKELMAKAKTVLHEKIQTYEEVLGISLDTFTKEMNDDYIVVVPDEMYKSYKAYNSSSLKLKQSAKVDQIEKSESSYYHPFPAKDYDFIVNPIVFEPVIQVVYELRLKIVRTDPLANPYGKATKEYLLITPSGQIRRIDP